MANEPDVSVIIAAWSAAAFIAPAIRSALDQEGVSVEVIVIDDASPDRTAEAALEAAPGDARLRVERLAANGGPSTARNRAIDLATGRYIAVLDADDSFAPGRLERLVRLADETGADLVADNMTRRGGADGTRDDGPFLRPAALAEGLAVSLADYVDPRTRERFGAALGYLKPVFRRVSLERLGVRYDPSLRNSEDHYLVAELLARGAEFRLSASAGYNYLVREGSLSHRLSPALTGAIVEAERRFHAAHLAGADTQTRAAMRRRLARWQHVHQFEQVIDALKQRRPVSAARALVGRPASIAYSSARLASIGVSRLRP